MRRMQARTQSTMGAALRARKQPPHGKPIYNANLQRGESSKTWWTRKAPLSKLHKEVQATPHQE